MTGNRTHVMKAMKPMYVPNVRNEQKKQNKNSKKLITMTKCLNTANSLPAGQ